MKIICLSFAIFFFASCDSSVAVRIILPDGFRGVVRISPQKSSPPPQYKDGVYVYVIPSTGMLETEDVSPFGQWHSLEVLFEDGAVLQVSDEGRVPPFDGQLRFFYLGVSEGVRKFFVGTDRDYSSIAIKKWKDL